MIVVDFIACLITIFLGLNLKRRYPLVDPQEWRLLDQLFAYHLLMGFVFYLYIQLNGGDALQYWSSPKFMTLQEVWVNAQSGGSKSFIMYLIHFIPSNLLGLSFFSGSVLYAVLGYWSFLYLFMTLKSLMPNYRLLANVKLLGISIFPLVLFFPNVHFWSSGVGKDTLLFFAVALFIYSILDIRKRFFGLAMSLTISYFLRPHITLFLVSGFGLGYLLDSRLKIYQKVLFIIAASLMFFPLLEAALELAKIDEFSYASFEQFSTTKSGHLTKAGSGVDISSYSYPMKVFTFLYRPLFFDAHNALAFISSFENMAMLLLSVKFIFSGSFRYLRRGGVIVPGSFFFFLIGALAFAPVLSNLGIILREKNMFIPCFFVFLLAGFYCKYILPGIPQTRAAIYN